MHPIFKHSESSIETITKLIYQQYQQYAFVTATKKCTTYMYQVTIFSWYVCRSSEEIFALFISIAFSVDAFKNCAKSESIKMFSLTDSKQSVIESICFVKTKNIWHLFLYSHSISLFLPLIQTIYHSFLERERERLCIAGPL